MHKFKNIKYILLDAGNVLFYKITHEDENIANLLNITKGEYRRILDKLIDEQSTEEKNEFKNMNTFEKEITYLNKLHKKICEYLNIDPTTEIIQKMTKYRIQGDYALKEDIIETLKKLKERYKLGILSNAPPSRRYHELKINNLDSYFDHIFISKELGLAKPNPEIFKYVLREIGYLSQEVLFIDDKFENLNIAKQVGIINLVLFNRDQKANNKTKHSTVNNLKEILSYL
jgi:putative hydrolase of the HAD superfamily